MADVRQTLLEAARALERAGVPDPRLDAEWLLAHVLGMDRLAMRMSGAAQLTPQQEQRMASLLLSRTRRTPLQYLLGTQGFYGLEIQTDARALIPRQETETLCETGIAHLRALGPATAPEALDLCTGAGAVALVSHREKRVFPAQGQEKFTVALIDYGAKQNIIRCLCARGCKVISLPFDVTAEEVLSLGVDGVMLSNGPGDPKENVRAIAEIKKLLGKLPVFGICLGHQLTALALGGDTVKLKYGHRGANQPVKRLSDGRCFITSQNHGYAVVSESMKGKGVLSYINANDFSCEGLDYPELGCFTVQFHPEAAGGPRDTGFLFDRFISMMGGKGNA